MSLSAIFLSVLFFTVLGMAYVKGYDFVKRRSPEHLVHFYLVMATIRLLLIATVVAIYVFLSDSREDSIHFAAMFIGMYVVMMIITLVLKH